MNRLREVRELHNLSQKDVAEFLNVTQPANSRWETGQYDIDLENLKKLAQRYSVSIDYLLGNDTQGRTLLRRYLLESFSRKFTEKDIDYIERMVQLLEEYKKNER